MTITLNPSFNIGQKVWSSLGDNEYGIILDWSYRRRENCIIYLVSFGANESSKWFYEEELSDNIVFQN